MTDQRAAQARDEVRERIVAQQVAEIAERRASLDAGEPIYVIYRCPVCLQQKRGPGGHSVAGDDSCQGVGPDGEFHSARLERVLVVPA